MPIAKITERLYGAAETATILRLKLGPIREWSDTLADHRRGRGSINGFCLLPFLCSRVDGNKRPFYRMCDIDAFVAKVKALGIAAPPAMKTRVFEFDDPSVKAPPHWKVNILIPKARSWHRATMCQHLPTRRTRYAHAT